MWRRWLVVMVFVSASSVWADEERHQVIIEDTVNGSPFRDAIYYPDASAATLAKLDGSFKRERSRRIEAFRAASTNPPHVETPTRAELETFRNDLQAQLDQVDAQLAALTESEAIE